MRIRQHPTYRHRQLCTIVAIIRNLSKFETIFYRFRWQTAIARARRSRDAPRRVLFGALAIGKADTPGAPAISLSLNTPTQRRYFANAQYASRFECGRSMNGRCARRIGRKDAPIAALGGDFPPPKHSTKVLCGGAIPQAPADISRPKQLNLPISS